MWAGAYFPSQGSTCVCVREGTFSRDSAISKPENMIGRSCSDIPQLRTLLAKKIKTELVSGVGERAIASKHPMAGLFFLTPTAKVLF